MEKKKCVTRKNVCCTAIVYTAVTLCVALAIRTRETELIGLPSETITAIAHREIMDGRRMTVIIQ